MGAEFLQPPGGLALSAVSTCVPSLTPPLCSRQGQMVSVSPLTLPWMQAHRNAVGGGEGVAEAEEAARHPPADRSW